MQTAAMKTLGGTALVILLVSGCGSDATGPTNTAPLDLDMRAEDFSCILDSPRVGNVRIANPLGFLDEALAVAESGAADAYPVGTILSLAPQAVMVKRASGFSAVSNDWEFFQLAIDPSGVTTILDRGTTEVTAGTEQTCFQCHSQAAGVSDFVCGAGNANGCIGFEPAGLIDVFLGLQDGDPRCGG